MFVIDQAVSGFAPAFSEGRLPSGAAIWFIRVADLGLVLGSAGGESAFTQMLPPDWSGFLIDDRIGLRLVEGSAEWYAADIEAFAKLQAFADAGRMPDGHGSDAADQDAGQYAGPGLIVLPVTQRLDGCIRRVGERWFLMQMLHPSTGFERMCAVLRRTESYRLVRFLLAQPAGMKMRQLSQRYGLSYSHFRSLCHRALGRGGKAEIQQWRNVRALLDMVDSADGGGSLTDVALRQGFASSAHFSDAMKNQFGIAPSNLMRMPQTGKT